MIAGATTQTTTTTTPTNIQKEFVHRSAWKASVLGSLNVLFAILAIRLILLVAVVGAIFLTIIAVNAPDVFRLAAVGVYAAIVVVPLIWLSSRH